MTNYLLSLSGFAIFSVLGYMYLTKCVDSFAEVAAQGPELAFVVYPEGGCLIYLEPIATD